MATKRSSLSTKQQRIDRVMTLMAIRGKSGEEQGVADFIKKQLIKAGASKGQITEDSAHRRTIIKGNQGNLTLRLPGTVKGPRRMLSAHMDTVPICVGCEPRIKGNLVTSVSEETGLGADDRAGCAVVLSTAIDILRSGLPHPPLTFCWFVQEEVGLQGVRHMSKAILGNPAMAFNWDGGVATKLTVGATGGYRIRIEIDGIASHAGVAPERGVSAISIAAVAIADLQQNGWLGLVEKGKQKGTANVGVIEGGQATNVVTDKVIVRAEARSHNSKFRERIVKEIRAAFDRAVKQVKNVEKSTGSVLWEGRLDYDSFKLSPKQECVQIVQSIFESMGHDTSLAIANGGLDANWLNAFGIPTVSMGCGQMNAHMVTETLDLKQYLLACDLGLRIATADD